jgi:hypothetical protein
MKLFEKVDSVAHHNYQDSNEWGPLNFVKTLGGVVGAQHNPMQYWLICRQINGKFTRWIIILQEYNLEFSTPKRNKSLVLAELVTAFPYDTTSTPVNTKFPDEHLFYITSDDPWYDDLLICL